MSVRARDTRTLSIDFAAAMERREAGMERVRAHADRVEDGWSIQALAMLTAFANTIGRPFLAEEARPWAYARGLPRPPDERAWGPVTKMATSRKRPRIRKVGTGPAASSNGSDKPLYVAFLHAVPSSKED